MQEIEQLHQAQEQIAQKVVEAEVRARAQEEVTDQVNLLFDLALFHAVF